MNQFTRFGVLAAVEKITRELSPSYDFGINISFANSEVSFLVRDNEKKVFILRLIDSYYDMPCVSYTDYNDKHCLEEYEDWQDAYNAFVNILQSKYVA